MSFLLPDDLGDAWRELRYALRMAYDLLKAAKAKRSAISEARLVRIGTSLPRACSDARARLKRLVPDLYGASRVIGHTKRLHGVDASADAVCRTAATLDLIGRIAGAYRVPANDNSRDMLRGVPASADDHRILAEARRQLTALAVEPLQEVEAYCLAEFVEVAKGRWIEAHRQENHRLPDDPELAEAASAVRRKRSTERGEGTAKLIAALTKHHKYADGSCLHLEPVANNALARLAGGVSRSTASQFFKKHFGGWDKYRTVCLKNAQQLAINLGLLSGDVQRKGLATFGRKPPGEGYDEE